MRRPDRFQENFDEFRDVGGGLFDLSDARLGLLDYTQDLAVAKDGSADTMPKIRKFLACDWCFVVLGVAHRRKFKLIMIELLIVLR